MTRAPRRVDTLHHTTPAAAQALLDLLALTHTQEAQALGLAQPPRFTTTLASLMASRAFYLGAWVGENLVGALALGPDNEAGQLALQTLVVHPAHQRQGHGQALLLNTLQRTAGLTLSVVAGAANAAALTLYRRHGFEVYRQGWMTVGPGPTEGTLDATAPPSTGGPTGMLMLKMRRTTTA